MSYLESSQAGSDKASIPGFDQADNRPLVDMANRDAMRSIFQQSAGQGDFGLSSSGQLTFNDPFESTVSGWKGSGGLDQQLGAQLGQVEKEVQQLSAEIKQLFGGDGGGTAETETSPPAQQPSELSTVVPLANDGSTPAAPTSDVGIPTSNPTETVTSAGNNGDAAVAGSSSGPSATASSNPEGQDVSSGPAATPNTDVPVTGTAGGTSTTGSDGSSVTGINATVNGFFDDANGQALNLVGLNASPEDAVAGFANVQSDFPGLTALRLNVSPSDLNDPNINTAVQEYTNAGIAVELEVHDTNGVGSGYDSTYEQWAQDYKNNPLVMLETPNEPSGSTVASDDAQYIQEIRAQGFNNPIGIQPISGYDESNIPTVLSDLQSNGTSTSNLYVTPHIYYGGTSPTGAAWWAQGEVAGAQQQGLPAFIDEYGPAMDGVTLDPQGETVNQAMYSLDQQGYGTQAQVGSTYWGMDNGNHSNGADSAFLTPDGSQLTSDGQLLQQTILS